MREKPTIADCVARLTSTGWLPNMGAMRQHGQHRWYVCGHRGEHTILGRGYTRADAWRAALMAADSSA